MRRYNMEIEKGIPKIGGCLSLNLGQDAKMQPTPKGIVGKITSWRTFLLLLCSSLLASCLSTYLISTSYEPSAKTVVLPLLHQHQKN